MEPFACRFEQRRPLSDSVHELTFARADGEPLRFTPGQYVQVLLPDDGARGAGDGPACCYYSLSSPPRDDGATFALCIKDDGGDCASYMLSRAPGDTVRFAGPGGALVLLRQSGDEQRELLLVATGTGIAPFVAMRHELEARVASGGRVRLLYGARRADELLYDELWRGLADKHDGFVYAPTVSAPDGDGDHHVGRVTAHLASALAAMATERVLVLVCGGPAMVADVKAQLADGGVALSQIRTE